MAMCFTEFFLFVTIDEEVLMEFLLIREEADIRRLSRIAKEIIRSYYDPILGEAQNTYMIELFQSEAGIRRQITEGYTFYLPVEGARPLGFFAYRFKEDHMYLSKFYLYSTERGKGFGREILRFLMSVALESGVHAIELNVNKENPTIAVYEKMGFRRIRAEKNDIGHGYYMDDYVYRLEF